MESYVNRDPSLFIPARRGGSRSLFATALAVGKMGLVIVFYVGTVALLMAEALRASHGG